MAEKASKIPELEQIFLSFEKRQNEKFKEFEEKIVNQFHIISEGLIDHIKLLAEGHSGIIDRLKIVDKRLDQIEKEGALLADGQLGITRRLDQIEKEGALLAEGHLGIIRRLDQMEKENERQHLETRSLIKLSFAELDRRLSNLESQVKEIEEWKKQVESRFQT